MLAPWAKLVVIVVDRITGWITAATPAVIGLYMGIMHCF
jgi:hypothetical protein